MTHIYAYTYTCIHHTSFRNEGKIVMHCYNQNKQAETSKQTKHTGQKESIFLIHSYVKNNNKKKKKKKNIILLLGMVSSINSVRAYLDSVV